MLCGLAAVLQASGLDGLSFDPFSLKQDGLGSAEVDVGRGEIGDALVVAQVIVVGDEVTDLGLHSTSRMIASLSAAGVPHPWSPPSAIMLFLSSRSSSACSATTSFSSWAWRRKSLTSSEVAARAVSPASRRLPASRNSFDQL